MPKVEKKPRGRKSSYAFFMQKCKEEQKMLYPEKKILLSEFSKNCSDRWKEISEEDKQMFNDVAEKDKFRFENEMANYAGPQQIRGRKKKQKKDPNAPKRALSAYFLFAADERPKIRKDNPVLGVCDIMKEIASRWRIVSQEEKCKYNQMNSKDKDRYEQDMKKYNSKIFNESKKVDSLSDDDKEKEKDKKKDGDMVEEEEDEEGEDMEEDEDKE